MDGGSVDLGPSPVERVPLEQRGVAEWVVIGAREEVRRGTLYDASYVPIEYPGGDTFTCSCGS